MTEIQFKVYSMDGNVLGCVSLVSGPVLVSLVFQHFPDIYISKNVTLRIWIPENMS